MPVNVPSGKYPLVQYLKVESSYIGRVQKILRSASLQVERDLKNIDLSTISGQVRAVQAQAQLAAIQNTFSRMQASVYTTIKEARNTAAQAASAVVTAEENQLFQLVLSPDQMAEIAKGEAQRAVAGLEAAEARILSSQLPLSTRVYQSQVLQDGSLQKAIDENLARGISQQQFAREIRKFIDPAVPGGASYSAMRLARTEINNAYHAATVQRYKDSGIIDDVDWHLSSSHPEGDQCDELQAESPFPIDQVPAKPHPQCLCYITAHLDTPAAFLKNLLAGKYDNTSWPADMDAGLLSQFKAVVARAPKAAAEATATSVSAKMAALTPKIDALPRIPGDLGTLATNPALTDWKIVNPGYLAAVQRESAAAIAAREAYLVNCTRTAAAIELRARGYDVAAGARLRTVHDNYASDIARKWQKGDGTTRYFKSYKTWDEAADAMEAEGTGSRFFIIGTWRGGRASHIWNAEINDRGILKQYDGQTAGVADTYWNRLSNTYPVEIMRTDDLTPTDGLAVGTGRTLPSGKTKIDTPWVRPQSTPRPNPDELA